MNNIKQELNSIKQEQKIIHKINKSDQELLKLVRIAGQIVLIEDKKLFQELAKY